MCCYRLNEEGSTFDRCWQLLSGSCGVGQKAACCGREALSHPDAVVVGSGGGAQQRRRRALGMPVNCEPFHTCLAHRLSACRCTCRVGRQGSKGL